MVQFSTKLESPKGAIHVLRRMKFCIYSPTELTSILRISFVGPTNRIKSINPPAKMRLMRLKFFIPLSKPKNTLVPKIMIQTKRIPTQTTKV